ncbi:hypothetical protein AB0I81_61770 [Nonomuraea sp. NPDC050404]|uniref:hypothetical protein n=1 Tax=Nonomuraea sp. NPDC050404 TaxID=3155783 RepID=UPI0033E3D2F6
MERALGGELIEQGVGTDLVETCLGCVVQNTLQVPRAVETLQPPPDGFGQAAQHDRPEGVHAVLQGVFVAEDAAESGLYAWPHGRKVSMPEQDPERVPRRLWITAGNRHRLWISGSAVLVASTARSAAREDRDLRLSWAD